MLQNKRWGRKDACGFSLISDQIKNVEQMSAYQMGDVSKWFYLYSVRRRRFSDQFSNLLAYFVSACFEFFLLASFSKKEKSATNTRVPKFQ